MAKLSDYPNKINAREEDFLDIKNAHGLYETIQNKTFDDPASTLNQYDAMVGANSSHYQEVYEYLFRTEPDEVRETLVMMHTDIARSNNGIFYSKKYNCISPGVFELQNRLEPKEFINQLKNTL